MNYDKNPKEFTTTIGLGRGLSASGKYKAAITYVQAALPLAPNDQNKTNVETISKTLA